MRKNIKSFLQRLRCDDNGQVLVMTALLIVAFMGVAAMVADVGDIYYAYNELQASTQAAALAGGIAISNPNIGTPSDTTDATPQEVATYYGSQTGSGTNAVNTHPILTSAGQNVSTTAYLSCNSFVSSLGIVCITYNGGGTATANAIQVVQVAQVKTYFAAIFGTPSVTLTATATAARSGVLAPYNIAIIIDTTASMSSTDSNCPSGSTTRLKCALTGVQALLQSIAPCYTSESSCGTATSGAVSPSVDRVALFTFPNISTATVSDDYTSCDKTNPTIEPYTFPSSTPTSSSTYSALSVGYYATPSTPTGANPVQMGTSTVSTTYEITYGLGDANENGFVSDYKTSDTATTLNTASDIVLAVGGKSGCNGVGNPGGAGTFYAGAIYAATAALAAEQTANPNVPNVIILVSDGDATSGGTGSWSVSCTEGSTNCAPTSCGTSTNCTPTTGTVAHTTWSCSKSGSTTTCKNSTINEMGSASTCSTTSACSTAGVTLGAYPSAVDECSQAITAAKYAVSSGVVQRVYTVAYGAESTSCSTDTSGTYSGVSPCTTMKDMASSPNYFYSDYNQSGSGIDTGCVGTGNSTSNLEQIFSYIAADLGVGRLIPNSEFPTP